MTVRTWFITGVSGGIGRAIAHSALIGGDIVYGTVRQASQLANFEALAPGRARPLTLDVTDSNQVESAVREALNAGPVEILVNNAGLGMVGAVEETSMADARTIFETNFFGVLRVTQAFLPAMRARRSGRIINISSGVGLMSLPGMPLYSASKHALEGLMEALAAEVASFGIKVSLIEPGAIRTSFTGLSMLEASEKIPDHAPFSGYGRAGLAVYYESAAAPPEAVAGAVIQIANESSPPLRRLVGADVLTAAHSKLQQVTNLIQDAARHGSQADP